MLERYCDYLLGSEKDGQRSRLMLVGEARSVDSALGQIEKSGYGSRLDVVALPLPVVSGNESAWGEYGRDIEREYVRLGGSPLIAICASSLGKIHFCHAACGRVKKMGARVVTPYVRTIFAGPVSPSAGGLTYADMFSLAGKFAQMHRRQGDYLEFGVFDGRTLSLAWQCMKSSVDRFFAFDSFEGIVGARVDEVFEDGTYFSNLPTFQFNMAVAGADANRIIPVKGNFIDGLVRQICVQHKLTTCLVAHIDCDVYAAAKAALDFLTPLLVQGSIILFDEYHANLAENSTGERRAVSEWLEENPTVSLERWHDYALVGRSFIVHKLADR